MVLQPLLLPILDIKLVLGHDGPTGLGNYPERSNSLVLREVVSLGHIFVPKIDLEGRVGRRLYREDVIELLELRGVLGS
jgi:hypothetical protein